MLLTFGKHKTLDDAESGDRRSVIYAWDSNDHCRNPLGHAVPFVTESEQAGDDDSGRHGCHYSPECEDNSWINNVRNVRQFNINGAKSVDGLTDFECIDLEWIWKSHTRHVITVNIHLFHIVFCLARLYHVQVFCKIIFLPLMIYDSLRDKLQKK